MRLAFLSITAYLILGGLALAQAGNPAGQNAPAAQRSVLYEEDPTPAGTQYSGTAVWSAERVSRAPGQKPDVVIRADVQIPERGTSVRVTLSRNDDTQVPASHLVEIQFSLPADLPHGGISNIPGIMMKDETARGTALDGVAVKVLTNYFMVGLSSVDEDKARNIQLLKERSWLDIPVVYSDGRRAVIALEKGTSGERAFSEAFAAWDR